MKTRKLKPVDVMTVAEVLEMIVEMDGKLDRLLANSAAVTAPAPVPLASDDGLRQAYSLREAAQALSISTTTLGRAISHGLIKSTKVGRAVRIPVEEIQRIVREGVPRVSRGYKRLTTRPTKPGRPRGRKRVAMI